METASQYSTLKNIIYIIKKWIKWDLVGVIKVFLRVPVVVSAGLVASMLSKSFTELIMCKAPFQQFVMDLGGAFMALLLLNCFRRLLDENMDAFQQGISIMFATEAFNTMLNMDYDILESFEGQCKFERCRKFALQGSHSDGAWASSRISGLLECGLGILTYLTALTLVHPVLVTVIVITSLFEYLISKSLISAATKTENEMTKQELRFSYFFRTALDISAGKDIRLNGAAAWLISYVEESIKAYQNIMHWFTKQTTRLSGMQLCCAMLRDLFTLCFLVLEIFTNKISLPDFVFYFGLVSGISGWTNNMTGHITSLKRIAIECRNYRDFLDLTKCNRAKVIANDKENRITKASEIETIDSIEFQNVSFSYDNSGEVLKNISFKVKVGESIAVVGENGSGKTTLIKLIAGLYQPTSGRILINGLDRKEIPYETYYKMVSALFQDYTVLPGSVLDNVAMSTEADVERVKEVLRSVDLIERIDRGQAGINSSLHKEIDSNALSLSGGEMQRLLFARALYKNAHLLLLDEPTAALDPLAEEQLYFQYNKLSKSQISFFTSHRLASTKFCDYIYLMDDGKIVEHGTHEELITKQKKYYEMYKIQGFYYRERLDKYEE